MADVSVPVMRVESDSGTTLPAYARPGDAGADLVAAEDVVLTAGGGRALVRTGVAVAIPEGHAGLVLPRSGLAFNQGVTVLNAPGLIDSGYRGELKVLLVNTGDADYQVSRGDRVAQLVVQAVERADFTLVDELPADSGSRGEGGFGHTGR